MAWNLVGTQTHDVADGSSSGIDLAVPSSLENDILVVFIGKDSITVPTINTSGYTTVSSNATGPAYHLAIKKQGATPDTVVNVTRFSTRRLAVTIQVWRGQDLTTPQDVAAVDANGTTGMPNAGSITPVTDGALVLVFGVIQDVEDAGVSAPSGFSNLATIFADAAVVTTSCTAMMASKEVSPAAATDAAAFGGSSSDNWRAVAMALRPAAAGGVESRTVSIAGAGAASFTSKADKKSTLTGAGLGALSPVSKALKTATLTASGTGTFNAIGVAAVIRTFAITGAGAFAPVSKATKSAQLASAGVAAVAFVAKATAKVTLTAAGAAAVAPQSKALKSAVLAAAGQATVTFIGDFTGGGAPAEAAHQAGFVANIGRLMNRK